MYPGLQAKIRPHQPAFIMATSGETVTYAELEARSNRLAHFLRASGLGRLDHYGIFMENNARYVECCSAGERAGLYYTCVNSYLTADEVAYIVDNSESKVLITGRQSEQYHNRTAQTRQFRSKGLRARNRGSMILTS
jgi:long-chain acyl-CoA synthetase